jgi:hypothetical protein
MTSGLTILTVFLPGFYWIYGFPNFRFFEFHDFAVLRVIGCGGGPLGLTAIQGMMQPANNNVHVSNRGSSIPDIEATKQYCVCNFGK